LVAVQGIGTLLHQGFFVHDVGSQEDSAHNSKVSTRLTLLDLTIQGVCDVAMYRAQETSFGACVEAVQYAQGQFAHPDGWVRSAAPSPLLLRPNPLWRAPSEVVVDRHEDFPLLLDPHRHNGSSNLSYWSGGAPQAAVSLSIFRLGKVSIHDLMTRRNSSLENDDNEDAVMPLSLENYIDGMLSSVLDQAVAHCGVGQLYAASDSTQWR
jgi:hypothetical protein